MGPPPPGMARTNVGKRYWRGEDMYASIRTYRTDPARMDEAMHRIDEGFAELVSREPGFCAYQAMDCGGGSFVSCTVFRDREGAERSAELAAEWVAENLADIEFERLDAKSGEVMVSRAIAEVLEPAHH